MTLQVETAKDLLNTNDATIIGVLLAVIVVLIYWNIRTDKKLEKGNTYIREQDKANLTMIQDLINTVNKIGNTSEKNADKIDNVDNKASDILTIIKERLTRQNNE